MAREPLYNWTIEYHYKSYKHHTTLNILKVKKKKKKKIE